MKELIDDKFAEHKAVALRDPILYGDYRNCLVPEEPRLYEDVIDYNATKAIFEEVCMFANFHFVDMFHI